MAIEAPIRESDQFFTDEDKTLRFFVTTGEAVVLSATALAAATTLEVEPLKETIASAAKVRFGNIVVTLTAQADAGDTSIAVSALTGAIPRGSVGRKCQNVTGWTTQFKILSAKGSSTTVLTVSGSVITATEGVIDVVIADTDTATFTPKSYYYTFRRTDAGSESMLAHGLCALQAG